MGLRITQRDHIRLSALLYLLVLDNVFFMLNMVGTIIAYKNDKHC